MSNANLLILFGSILGMIGSVLLSIDALGAQDFLSSVDKEKGKPFEMTLIGFRSTINDIFVYLAVSILGFLILSIVFRINIVLSLLIAPIIYFGWNGVIYLSVKIRNTIQKLGPSDLKEGEKSSCLFSIFQLVHVFIWAALYFLATILSVIIEFGLDIPLRFISERLVVPFTKRFYEASAKIVSEDKKWNLKRTVLIGTLFLLFGFIYQFIGTILTIIKW